MPQYKREHESVEAYELTRENAEHLTYMSGGRLVQEKHPITDESYPGINVPTIYGMERLSLGDYIVKNPSGGWRVERKAKFEQRYEVD